MKELFENESLVEIRKYARENHIPVLLDDTAHLLISQIEKLKPESILEIGTAIGYSGTLMLKSCLTSKLVTIEKDNSNFLLAKKNFKEFDLHHRVTQIFGDAYEEIEKLNISGNKFDFIFLDGPKGQYVKYLPILKNMLNLNGVLFSDNVLFKGLVNGPEFVAHRKRTIVMNLRKFLNLLENDSDFISETIEIGDGVNISKLIK